MAARDATDFDGIPTGVSDAGCIEIYAENPVHWVTVRAPEVGRCWEERGTWLRPPLLLDRRLLDPSDSGLQVLEGRTHVGVLRGRFRESCSSPQSTGPGWDARRASQKGSIRTEGLRQGPRRPSP